MADSFMQRGQTITRRFLLKWMICVGSVLVFVLYMILPANRIWLQSRIFPYFNSLRWQISRTEIESRREIRFGEPYRIAKRIQKEVEGIQTAKTTSTRLLLPSGAYMKARGFDVELPDPVTFYYFTGVQSAKPANLESTQTNWFLGVESNGVKVYPFLSDRQRNDSIVAFKQ